MSNSKIDLVESVYLLDEGHSWFDDVSGPLRASVDGIVGCFAYELRERDGRPAIGRMWTDADPCKDALEFVFDAAPTAFLQAIGGLPLAVRTVGEALREVGIDPAQTLVPPMFERAGAREGFAVVAADPNGEGAVFGAFVDASVELSAAEREHWVHAAVHVAAGVRLRVQLEGAPVSDHADAVLRPDGKLEHAEIPIDAEFEGLLRDSVAAVERARSGKRSDEGLALWQGLVGGRWSLVEHYEGPTRRYYVATRNDPRVVEHRALSPRERQVVGYIVGGASVKHVGYALGIERGTVRYHLSNAMTKLGVGSRVELIELYAALDVRAGC